MGTCQCRLGIGELGLDQNRIFIRPHVPGTKKGYLGAKDVNHQTHRYRTYNCRDVLSMMLTAEPLQGELAEFGQDRIFYQEFMPLNSVVRNMQNRGFRFNLDKANQHVKLLLNKAELVRMALSDGLGWPNFNPNSPKQVGELFYDGLKLTPLPRSGRGTEDVVLRKLAIRDGDEALMKLVIAILTYRKITKLIGTYLRPIPVAEWNPKKHKKKAILYTDGRVRSRWGYAVTGRLRSMEPNLQNLPVRGLDEIGVDIKDVYEASPGCTLLYRDYSQLEARIAAYVSGCRKLIALFESGYDFHDHNARILWSISPDAKPTKDQRRYAKEFAFAVTYGGGADTIMDRALKNGLVLSKSQTIRHIAMLTSEYPEIATWRERQFTIAKRDGVIYTPLGRHRVLYGADIRGISANFPIQGMAAHIMNRAMIRMASRNVYPVAQVHDSLILDTNTVIYSMDVMKEEMERPIRFLDYEVSFPTEGATGQNWGEL